MSHRGAHVSPAGYETLQQILPAEAWGTRKHALAAMWLSKPRPRKQARLSASPRAPGYFPEPSPGLLLSQAAAELLEQPSLCPAPGGELTDEHGAG